MEEFVIAIDDTGFSTKEKHYETLRSEECCFCSVAIRKDVLTVFNNYMKEKTDELFNKFGTREFHFTDMYNRRGDFKTITIDETLDIVESFAQDMIDCGMIITVSTINKHSYSDPQQVQMMDVIKKYILPKLNLPDQTEAVDLVLNIIRSQQSLEQVIGKDAVITEAVCDEGLKKVGSNFKLPLSKGEISVQFEHSTNYLLQFADFVAWFVTRVKHICDKDPLKIKSWEEELLFIYSKLPFANLKSARYLINNNKPFNYDKAINNLMSDND